MLKKILDIKSKNHITHVIQIKINDGDNYLCDCHWPIEVALLFMY